MLMTSFETCWWKAGRELGVVGWTWCVRASVGAIGANVALYRYVTTSVCVSITRYRAARRTSLPPHGGLLRWLNTGRGGSRHRWDNSCEEEVVDSIWWWWQAVKPMMFDTLFEKLLNAENNNYWYLDIIGKIYLATRLMSKRQEGTK